MRLKDIAHEIGITRQELRQELQKTNFGIDPNAREVPDALGWGIIRVIGPKFKDKKKEQDRREAARLKAAEMSGEVIEKKEEKLLTHMYEEVDEEEESPKKEEPIKKEETSEKPAHLRGPIKFRTSLEIEQRKKDFEEQRKKEQDERKKREEERQKPVEKAPVAAVETLEERKQRWAKKGVPDYHSDVVNVTRKIELGGEGGDRERLKKKKKGGVQEVASVHHKPSKRFKTQVLDDISPEEQVAFIAEEQIRRQLEDEAFKLAQAKRRQKVTARQQIDESLVKKDSVVEIPEHITVKEFSEKLGVGVGMLISTLLKNGIMATMNSRIDYETWALLADELDVKIKREELQHSVEDILKGDLAKLMQDDNENLKERPPVVVVMGHVDHGKTSILDFYRSSNVVSQESGGITQHVGAYQVEQRGKKITFIDTPGHEAFTSMRARGAKVTDIAILVVAADESIKAQTIEAYNHAKEAKVPVIVAVNKVDKEGANVEKVKGDLMTLGLVSEDYGGDTMVVPVSAKTGQGMENLLDSILLQAEVLELKANPNRSAIATVIESHLDKAMGPVATLIVNTGTFKPGDVFICGHIFGKVRTMHDSAGKRLKEALPSGAIHISGFEEVPQAGDIIQVLPSEKEARERSDQVKDLKAREHMGLGMSEIISRIQSGKMKFLKIVLKGDAQGSIEAIQQMLAKINNDEVGVKVIHAAVGGVSESDIMMAAASEGLVIGFHVGMSAHARALAEKEGVEVQLYDIIYNLMEDVTKILTGMLQAEEVDIEVGRAEVKAIFITSKKKQIIGAKVTEGIITNGGWIKVLRKGEEVNKTKVSNLRSFEKDVQEVRAENECGIQFLQNFDYQEGDVLVCSRMEKKIKTL